MDNPFTSQQFTNTWLKHFNDSKPAIHLKSIKHVSFIKLGWLSYYVNVGKNLTKGIYYDVDESSKDYKNKTFLIYDVPDYFKISELSKSSQLKLKKIFQYQGFLMNLDGLENVEAYINSRFSGKNRREFRSNQRRLETCFNISYRFYHKLIERDVYDVLFKQFHNLLINRFNDKQTDYHHLDSVKWQYYTDLVFEMINAGKGSLLVIYKDETPIGITLNFHEKNILFETITVFDPDYYKFSIGKTSIIKLLEWCFDNEVSISDFSKGDFEYKHKWANEIYDFHYHILYDSGSFIAKAKANLLFTYFQFKNFLRKKRVNHLYRRLRYLLGNRQSQVQKKFNFNIEKIELTEDLTGFELIDYSINDNRFLRKFIYTFLFANPEPETNIQVYRNGRSDQYVIKGSKKAQKITLT